MTPEQIDAILRQSALQQSAKDAAPSGVYAAVLERTKHSIVRSLRPVRPMPPEWVLILGFLMVFGIVLAAGAAYLGIYGWRALTIVERVLIFAAVAGVACFAALAGAREMRPAGGPRRTGLAFALSSAGLLLLFALLFHDYGMRNFVRQGVPCLVAGLVFAAMTALLLAAIVRRGFVLNLVSAGIAAGTLAGLAGIGVLELHCPNLRAMHIMFWHVAVVVLSGLAGALTGLFLNRAAKT